MIEPSDFFVLRRPLYSISKLMLFYDRLAVSSLADALRQYYQDPLAQEALLIASPQLYDRFRRWLAGEPLSEEKKLLVTLHKYVIRMCSRSTPYGLFAGCSLGTFSEQSQLQAAPATTLRTHIRVDIDWLQAINGWLTIQPAIRAQLRLYPNSTLYPVGASLRYVEQQHDTNKRSYFISAVEVDPYLTRLLDAAQYGATITQLTALLTDIPAEEANLFVDQLIENQLLQFETEPTVTGENYLDKLTDRLSILPGAIDVTQALRDLATELKLDDRLSGYTKIKNWFSTRTIQLPTTDMVQVNTYFDHYPLIISKTAIGYLKRDLAKLLVLNQPANRPDLEAFKQRFINRYEEEEVPLSMALDSEFGVGYGHASTQGVGYAPLIDDLTFSTSSSQSALSWDSWQQFVLNKYAHALQTRQAEIVLTDDELNTIGKQAVQHAPLPTSFYAFGSLLARSAKAVDTGNYLFNLAACTGSSAMNLISRFGEGNELLTSHVQAASAAEEALHPDVVIAEVVHLPEDRVGNILARPIIHQHEIPYLGQSAVAATDQIPLTDLMVSVRQDQIILRSKRLNKRVIPRLTSAHNFTQGLPVYRFLCELQAQDAHLNLAWNWGILSTQRYLPRVRYGRVLISRATWQLESSSLSADNPLKMVAQLTAAGLPDQFVLAQADNELLITMHEPNSLELLAQEVRKRDRIRLVEFLFAPDHCPLTHNREAYAHELIIPFHSAALQAIPGISRAAEQGVQRRFSMGEEWFYLKLYMGEKASDALLVQAIYPTVRHLLHSQVVTSFFFIRYQDPDSHLRLRFKGNSHLDFYQYVVRAMEQALQDAVASGIVHRVQVDTYQRELERYGAAQIGYCETLFYYDSLETLTLLAQTGGQFDEDLRFAVSIAKINQLLRGLSFSPADCRDLLNQLKEAFFTEFKGDSSLRNQLNSKYRFYQAVIAQALGNDFSPVDGIWQWKDLKAEMYRDLIASTPKKARLVAVASSLIHMMVNRLFPTKQRMYELVLYHCLAKYYDSELARSVHLPTE